MQPTTDTRPATAAPHATTDTGAGAKAITANTAPLTAEYYAARLRYLQAQLQRARAQEAEHGALVAMYRAAQHASDGDRHMLATLAERDQHNARECAKRTEQHIDALLRDHPEALQGVEPHAVVTITIRRDEITTRATLHMGHQFNAQQTERRQDRLFWRSPDPDWVDHEDTLGIELVEFLDGIDLPRRVADMLPRAPTPAGLAAAAEAAAALRA
jgi:hypothetical protein